MRDGPAFRSIGIALALVLAISLAGCGALGGGDGGGCGPGDTKISSIADGEMGEQQQVSFTGEVVAAEGQDGSGGASYAIDDGTGTAFITAPPEGISEGDCVTVEGPAYANPAGAGADVIISPQNVSEA